MKGLLTGGLLYCSNCGGELNRGEQICPRCRFNPRDKGIRVANWLLAVVVASVLLAIGSVYVLPALGGYLLVLAGVSFVSSVIVLLLAFVATPYRLGWLFRF